MTIRKKRGTGDTNTNISHITSEARRKRTKTVDNVLNHVTENNIEFKADLLAKGVDKGGNDLGEMVTKKSRIRETSNLSTDADRRSDSILERLRDLSKKKIKKILDNFFWGGVPKK